MFRPILWYNTLEKAVIMNILFEDQGLIVCKKDPGQPVQSDLSGDKDLQTDLVDYMKSKGFDKPYIGLVHRLDRPVGGCVLFGKNPKMTAALSKQIQDRLIKKYYLAVVEGKPEDQTLVHYLKKKFKGNVSHVVDKETPKAKKAILHLKVIQTLMIDEVEHSLVRIELETGRHHQIRVQLAAIGHGIYGDTKYNETYMNKRGWFQIALYAYGIGFEHPRTKKWLTFEDYPSDHPFDKYDSMLGRS